jgi:hypothetical protein
MHLILIGLLTLAQQAAPSAREDRPEVREKLLELRKAPRVEKTFAMPVMLEDTAGTAILTLEAVLDRGVLVSVQIDEATAVLVERTGALRISRAEDVGHQTLWDGKYYRLLYLAETAPSDDTLKRSVGMPMKFVIGTRSDGRQVALNVKQP